MIVVQVTDPYVRKAALRAAGREEDVIVDPELSIDAIERGFPRLVIRDESSAYPTVPRSVRVAHVDDGILRRWEQARRSRELPASRLDDLTVRLAGLMEREPSERNWVDRKLADLGRASGRRLPQPLRGFGRRVLEFPTYYTTLHPVAEACGLSRGALKARFRRRDLASPAEYLRWFRIMAVAETLTDAETSVAVAARRHGFTSNGNLCRTMARVADMTPTEVREPSGRDALLLRFAWHYCGAEALAAWASLDDLFDRRVA